MVSAEVVGALNPPQTVFTVFFAIFWGLVASAQIRWKAFDWPRAIRGRKKDSLYRPSWSRVWQSVVYLTLVPIILFMLLVFLLSWAPPPPFDIGMMLQLTCAILAAHTAFAPYRLWLAAMERDPERFYYRATIDDDAGSNASFATQPGGPFDLRLNGTWAAGNSVVALVYVAFGLAAAVAGSAIG